jgi:hypothetical protein
MLLIFMIIFLISGYAWWNRGLLLSGACADQHQIRFSALEGGPRSDG